MPAVTLPVLWVLFTVGEPDAIENQRGELWGWGPCC